MRIHKPLLLSLLVLMVAGVGGAALRLRDRGADMLGAANQFLDSLPDDARKQATMAYDDPARLDWHFIPKPTRKGLQIKEMNDAQRKAAHSLMRTGASQLGYDKAVTIMHLEAILRELEKTRKDGPIRDPERYYFTVFGQPASQGAWGWSVEGHHLSLNFAVQDGRLASVTPAFYGANPAEVVTETPEGPKKGTRVLAKEEDLAFKLLHSCSPDQREAVVVAAQAPQDLRSAAEAQAPNTAPEGLPAEKMTEAQVQNLWELLQSYTDNMPAEIGAQRLAEVKEAGIGKVYFSWAGADKPGVGHYYRVQGPTFLIEFCNTQPDGSGNPANHIHSFWRQMSGDFAVSR